MDGKGWVLTWNYPDVLAVPSIGMDMPKLLNAGPVAARIAYFAPVSLVFFITVLLLLVGGLKGVRLHPMHVFFVAAGFCAFYLLFAWLMYLTAKADWRTHFGKRDKPATLPVRDTPAKSV